MHAKNTNCCCFLTQFHVRCVVFAGELAMRVLKRFHTKELEAKVVSNIHYLNLLKMLLIVACCSLFVATAHDSLRHGLALVEAAS